jgi:hypothetical protein
MTDTDLSANYKGAFGKRIGFGQRPALLMIDFVEAYFEPSCALYAGVEDALTSAIRLQGVARAAGVPVIYTNVVYNKSVLNGGRFYQKSMTLHNFVEGNPMGAWLLNRLQFTLVAEALHLVGEGYCDIDDIDAVLSDGLALRWAFLGPFHVAHLNAPDGIQGFVDRLGPMMRRLGRDARTDYDWTTSQIADAHSKLSQTIPVADIPRRQNERDRRILALRRLKAEMP